MNPTTQRLVVRETFVRQGFADSEREGEHGHGGEAGILEQLAEGEFEISHGSLSVVSYRLQVVPFRVPRSAFCAWLILHFAFSPASFVA
jgi:hypothetical protein